MIADFDRFPVQSVGSAANAKFFWDAPSYDYDLQTSQYDGRNILHLDSPYYLFPTLRTEAMDPARIEACPARG